MAALNSGLGQVGRVAAGFVAFVLLCAAAGWLALVSWADEAPVAVDTSDGSETASPAAQTGQGLHLHLSVPRHLVPDHRSPVTVTVRDGDGLPLPAETRLVVYAVVDGPGGQGPQAVVEGPAARPLSAGDLPRAPLYLVPAGSPACGQVVGELKVRVVTVSQTPLEAEQVRPVHGPPCDGPDVVPASESIHHDQPVRVDGYGWHGELDRLMAEPQPQRTPERRPARAPSTPRPTAQPEPTPSEEPEPEPSESEQPEPKPEPTPEPEPKPEPKPEPDPKPKPDPTPKPDPKPDPTPEPPPEDTSGASDR